MWLRLRLWMWCLLVFDGWWVPMEIWNGNSEEITYQSVIVEYLEYS